MKILKFLQELFKDKKSLRLIIILIFLLLAWTLYLFFKSPGTFTHTDRNGNVTKYERKLFEDNKEKAENDIERLNDVRLGLTKLELIKQIDSLIELRDKDKKLAQDLMDKFDNYDKLSESERKRFLQEAADFVATINERKSNKIDFGILGKEIEAAEKDDEIMGLKKIIENLNAQVASLTKERDSFKISYAEVLNLYADVQEQIKKISREKALLAKNDSLNKVTIAQRDTLLTSLYTSKFNLEDKFKDAAPNKITNIKFRPNSRSNGKEGTEEKYKSSFNKIIISFKLEKQVKTDNKKDTVRLFLRVPQKETDQKMGLPIDTILPYNRDITIELNKYHFTKDKKFEFGSGMYEVQFLDPNIHSNIPMDYETFTVK